MKCKSIFLIVLILALIIFAFACQQEVTTDPPDPQLFSPTAVITSIEISPSSINGTGSIDLTIDVESIVGAQITDVSVVFFSPGELLNQEGAEIEEYLPYDSTDDVFTGSINIGEYCENGDWKLGAVIIEDDKMNMWSDYYIDLSRSSDKYIVGNYSFYNFNPDIIYNSAVSEILIPDGVNVNTAADDTIFPVLNSFTLSPDTLSGSGDIIIQLDITETGGSGIYEVFAGISVKDSNGYGHGYARSCHFNSTTGKYEANLERDIINDPEWIEEEGTYYIDMLEITDNAMNKVSYEYINDKSSNYLMRVVSNNYSNSTETSMELDTIVISN